jgi:uncharacterized protein YcfJ
MQSAATQVSTRVTIVMRHVENAGNHLRGSRVGWLAGGRVGRGEGSEGREEPAETVEFPDSLVNNGTMEKK